MTQTLAEAPVTSPATEVAQWLHGFGDALARGDIAAACDAFADDSYWRDLVAFTWNLHTAEGRDAIGAMLQANLARVAPTNWQVQDQPSSTDGVTESWFTFETAVARGRGHLRLRNGRCWTLLTVMSELKGFEEKKGPRRVLGAEHGARRDRQTWLDRRQQEEAALGYTAQPYCVIIGGGQGGIGLAARLKRLGVPTLVIEKNPRAGDSWRNRYKSLCLHDP
ncbi:MAG TPA: nuclear transport factor 2 family protein, partial [Pseudorhodoferax sp.]|nr:nuclear transport factor 2 family protein [Pseudorhodoferax sp.]